MKHAETPRSRRELLRAAGRGAALTALAAVAAIAVARRGGKPAEVQPCINRGICGRCDLLDRCRLPQAQTRRAAKQKV